MNRRALDEEHDRLMKQTEELQGEYDALEARPDVNASEPDEHRLKLRQKLAELREHVAQLRAARALTGHTVTEQLAYFAGDEPANLRGVAQLTHEELRGLLAKADELIRQAQELQA